MGKQTRSDVLEFARKHGLTGISSTGGGDEPSVYTCNECGSSWKERDRYAWWPLEPKRSGIARQKRAESVEPIEGSEHAEHSQALGIHSVTNKVTKSLEGWGRQFAASLVGWESADDFALRLADGEDFE